MRWDEAETLAITGPAKQFTKLVITAAGQTFELGDYDKACPLISRYCPRPILEMESRPPVAAL